MTQMLELSDQTLKAIIKEKAHSFNGSGHQKSQRAEGTTMLTRQTTTLAVAKTKALSDRKSIFVSTSYNWEKNSTFFQRRALRLRV
jgi:hypothetical protein